MLLNSNGLRLGAHFTSEHPREHCMITKGESFISIVWELGCERPKFILNVCVDHTEVEFTSAELCLFTMGTLPSYSITARPSEVDLL